MPFTASHVAAVLPLARTPLVGSALAIGSMVPDAPLFLGGRPVDYWTTHSITGAATYDALLGLVVFLVWHLVLAPAAVAALPSDVQNAIRATTEVGLRKRVSSIRKCSMLYLSLVVGALTHVVWDAFTHSGRWGVERISWLSSHHRPRAGHEYAQHGSSIFGALVVGWWCYRWLRRNGIQPRALRLSRGARTAALVVVLAAALNVVVALAPRIAANRFEHVVFIAATSAIPAAALCALLLAAGWRVGQV